MSRLVTSSHVLSYHVMSCHVMARLVMSCHVISRLLTSCHVLSNHVLSCHVMSSHVRAGGSLPWGLGSGRVAHAHDFTRCHLRFAWQVWDFGCIDALGKALDGGSAWQAQ